MHRVAYVRLLCPIRATCTAHLIFLDLTDEAVYSVS